MSNIPEFLYGDVIRIYNGFSKTVEGGSFHFGGVFATEALADKLSNLQVDSNWQVLDLCCGWGGASQYIAERFGCRVLGIDLNNRSVARAWELVQGTIVENLVSFRQADALNLPMDSGVVDLIWSQDAFCHIPNRSRLLTECFRVICPGGHLVFTDLLKGEYLTTEEFDTLSASWFFPSLETQETYRSLLEETGFKVVNSEDVGHEYVIASEVEGIENGEPTFLQGIALASQDAASYIASYGQEHYRTTLELHKMMLYIAQARIRIGRFVCSKPTSQM